MTKNRPVKSHAFSVRITHSSSISHSGRL